MSWANWLGLAVLYLVAGTAIIVWPLVEGAGPVSRWIESHETEDADFAAGTLAILVWPLVFTGYVLWVLWVITREIGAFFVSFFVSLGAGVRDLVYPPSKRKAKVPKARVVQK